MDAIQNMIKQLVFERFNYNNNKSFTPNSAISGVAQSALQVIAKKDLTPNAGNDGSGKRKAMELSNKTPQNHQEMKRLKSFFDKYQQSVSKERSAGKDINSSGLIQMWDLHGGDQGQNWVNAQINSLNSSNKNTKQRLQKAGGAGENKGMGIFDNPMDNTETRTHSVWSKVKNREQNS